MSSIPPFLAQERTDSCAIACLRMLLANRGLKISEADLIRLTSLDDGGLTPSELARLARTQKLNASEAQIDDEELLRRVKHNHFPIVNLYRKVLDGIASVHAVIPIAFTKQFVTFLDPLRGKRRVKRAKFAKARAMVQQWAVIEKA
jgi:ABC-type bacteriocin/lantibiotic exporter with double-glycine peptidase domain